MTEELHAHSSTSDVQFHAERQPLKKAALLLTIPCAIVPIMIAAAGMMVAWSSPLLFRGDFILYGIAYLLYLYGLLLSYHVHRSLVPFAAVALHLASLATYLLADQPEWSGYTTVFSIMLTSIVNQFYRNGSPDCATCSEGSCWY
jgi:hypothetical protein